MITTVLVLQMAISVILMSVIFSFLNAGFITIKDQIQRAEGTTTVNFSQPVPFNTIANDEMEWRMNEEVKRLSYLVTTPDQVRHGSHTTVLPIFAVNDDYPYFFGFPINHLREGEAVLTINAVNKLFPSQRKENALGKSIEIAGKSYSIISIEQRSLVDRVYIPYTDYRQTYGNVKGIEVGSLVVDSSSSSVILKKLKPYSPIKVVQSARSKYQSFISFLIFASLITVFLVFYSILNFIQLYSFKVHREQNKWDMFFLLGATHSNLRSYLYTETIGLTIFSLLAAIIGYWWTVRAVTVNIDGIKFHAGIVVISIVTAIIGTMTFMTVELTIAKLRKNLFK